MAIDKVVKDLVIPEGQSDMRFVEGDTVFQFYPQLMNAYERLL